MDRIESDGATGVAGSAPTRPQPFPEHPLREAALREIHARPFHMMLTPRAVLHYAFMTGPVAAAEARRELDALCMATGVKPPAPEERQYIVRLGGGTLRWEQHGEFTTYSWDGPGPGAPGARNVATLADVLGPAFRAPGPLLVATRLDLIDDSRPVGVLLEGLDPGSIAVSSFRDDRAIGATDFKVDPSGVTRITLADRGMQPQEIGPLVQRLIEIETYRTLALLGLPEARRLQPLVASVETELPNITENISQSKGLTANQELLDRLTGLAAEVEAQSAASAFRFGASRAYAEIVRARLASVREGAVEGYSRWSSFLERRMGPAMRTVDAVASRIDDLSQRLARAANLLRTRVEVELEHQNRELLATMNQRSQMQLRLQTTVEGLSVAAVTYYVIGLISYLARGLVENFGWEVSYNVIAAVAVLPVMLAIFLFVRRVRRRHGGDE